MKEGVLSPLFRSRLRASVACMVLAVNARPCDVLWKVHPHAVLPRQLKELRIQIVAKGKQTHVLRGTQGGAIN